MQVTGPPSRGSVGWNRLAVLVQLVCGMGTGELGRTALMKFAFLLQELKCVPLGYRFSLYAYGPFDAAVLGDLSYLAALGAVAEKTVIYPSAYGYDIKPASNSSTVTDKAAGFLAEYQDQIAWVIATFGSYTAGELELISTIVYADREAARSVRVHTTSSLADVVSEIKPKFGREKIGQQVTRMLGDGLLKSVLPVAATA